MQSERLGLPGTRSNPHRHMRALTACAPHDLRFGVAAHLAHDKVEGEWRQLLHTHDRDVALLLLLFPAPPPARSTPSRPPGG